MEVINKIESRRLACRQTDLRSTATLLYCVFATQDSVTFDWKETKDSWGHSPGKGAF